MVGDSQTGKAQHRQVVRSVPDGDRLLQTDSFELAQKPQKLRLAPSVNDFADEVAGQFAVHNLKFVGIDVVETETLLEEFPEIGEASGEDGGLVANSLENHHHPFQTFVERKVAGDFFHHGFVQPFQEGHPPPETLGEIDFSAHRALRDRFDLLSDSCLLRQFVDALGVDQGRIHVEADQPAAASEDVILLEGEVDLGGAGTEEGMLEFTFLFLVHNSPDGQFDA